MIFNGDFITGVDLVDVTLWLFVTFFFALVFYLQQESRREGYPLESDETGKQEPSGVIWFPTKKTFVLPHGQGKVTVPHGPRDERELAMKRTAPWAGAPYTPTGNPMVDGVGPASYAERFDVADVTDNGRPRIAPFRSGDGYTVADGDPDPRGMTVYGVDGKAGGVVEDLWVDRSEAMVRYLEVRVGEEPEVRRVLLPMPFARINRSRKRVDVDAILGEQFAQVPVTKAADKVTRLEEDKIAGYFGGGKLYAYPARAEPLI